MEYETRKTQFDHVTLESKILINDEDGTGYVRISDLVANLRAIKRNTNDYTEAFLDVQDYIYDL